MVQGRDDRYAEFDWRGSLLETPTIQLSAVKNPVGDARRQELRAKARATYMRETSQISFLGLLRSLFGL